MIQKRSELLKPIHKRALILHCKTDPQLNQFDSGFYTLIAWGTQYHEGILHAENIELNGFTLNFFFQQTMLNHQVVRETLLET